MNVILASASPRRKELLKRVFDEFQIVPADIDETLPEDIGPEFAISDFKYNRSFLRQKKRMRSQIYTQAI